MSAKQTTKPQARLLPKPGKIPLQQSKIQTMKSAQPSNHIKVDEKFSFSNEKSAGSNSVSAPLRNSSSELDEFSVIVKNKCCTCGATVTLKEKNFIIKDNDEVCCIKCIEEEMTAKCAKCKDVCSSCILSL